MKPVGHPYKQEEAPGVYDAIVIGSGIGGLSAAALLAKHAGQKVLVLERHYTAGGFTHVFRRPGYEWDVGVHYIGGVGPGQPIRAAFDHLTEGRLQWNPMPDEYDRIRIGERDYAFPSGVDRFCERMKQYFPSEGQAIDRYIAAVLAAAGSSGSYFAEKAVPTQIARVLGGLMRWRFLRHAKQTTAEVLQKFTSNADLIAVLTGQWGDYGLPPGQSSFAMHAMVARHYFEGGWYPVGGASEIAAGIAPVIERAGGRILVGAEVCRILLDSKGGAVGVVMADGREFRARTVISDAGAFNTFARLLPPESGAGKPLLRELKSIAHSMSHVCLYVGLKQDGPETEAGNLWIYPDADHDGNVARFMKDPEAPFPVVFVSFPSAKDPTFASRYPGRSTIEVVAPAPYEWFERWAGERWKRRGSDYDGLKERFTSRLLEALERHVPATKGRVEYAELSTPLSTRHFANYPRGEIYGLSATPERFAIRSLGARTPVPNLYLAGQDVCVAGVTGALIGGAVTASAILHRNLLSVMLKRA